MEKQRRIEILWKPKNGVCKKTNKRLSSPEALEKRIECLLLENEALLDEILELQNKLKSIENK